jgi:hypothetical protein
MASVAEAIIFMYLGIAAVSDARAWNTAFIILTLLFCLIYRAVVIVALTLISNPFRLIKMTAIDQFIMSYGGLRGAIAFALVSILEAEEFSSHELFVTSTIVVVYFTNLIMGATMKPLVKLLRVRTVSDGEPTMSETVVNRMIDHVTVGIEAIAAARGKNSTREWFSNLNNKYLKPILVGQKPKDYHKHRGRGSQILMVYRQLNVNDALQLAQSPSTAESFLRWNASWRNLGLVGRGRGIGEFPWNSSGSTIDRTTAETPPDGSSRDVLAGSVQKTPEVFVSKVWSADDSIDDSLPRHWLHRRPQCDENVGNVHRRQSVVSCFIDTTTSLPGIFRAENGGSRSSLAALVDDVDCVSFDGDSRRRLRFNQLGGDFEYCGDDNETSPAASDLGPNGFIVIDEIIPRRDRDVYAARRTSALCQMDSEPRPTRPRHVQPSATTDFVPQGRRTADHENSARTRFESSI